MRDIKDTENVIGAGRLSAADRRKIFDSFLNAGGEVVSERKKRNTAVLNRERAAAEKKKQAQKAVRNRDISGTQASSTVNSPAPAVKRSLGFFQNLRIRFCLFWYNVLSSGKFHPDFILALNHELKSSLYSFYMLYMEIFEKTRKRSENVSEKLNSQSPIYFKLIRMAGELYPEFYSDTSSFEKNISQYKMRKYLTDLYRKLFLLYPCRNILNEGLSCLYNTVLDMYGDVIPEELEKEKILKNIVFVFSVFYKKLHWLVCSYEKICFSPDQLPEMERLLEIIPEEKPENRKCETVFKIREDEEAAKEEAEADQTEEKEQGRDEKMAAGGLEIMNGLNIQELRKKYDTKNLFELVPEDDSVFISFILFSHFMKEFSCIFDAGKVRFDGIVYLGSLIYPECLRDMYYETGKIDDSFADYADIADTYEKIKGEKPSAGDMYFAYSRRIQEILVRKERNSTFLRMTLRSFLERIMTVLIPLIDSMDCDGNDVLNQDEVLQDDSAGVSSSLKGKTVREAVITAAMYVSAFIKRLGPEGDLFDYSRNASVKKEEPVQNTVDKNLDMEYVMGSTEGKDDDTRSVFEQIDDIVF